MAQDLNFPALPTAATPILASLTSALGVPRDVLASDQEISYAWTELPRELVQIPSELRDELIVRMCVAVSSGLFDGAMNYCWNAAVLHLRTKVRNFGLPVVAQVKQRDFEEPELNELQDNQLLGLCLELNLIDEDGYFFLDQCRAVRNNFSAAHPTLGKVNDREFITFLNRCVRYALADSASPQGVDIGAFVAAVKGERFNEDQMAIWTQRLQATHDAQRRMLVGMVHGIYCDPDTSEPARLNSLNICTKLQDDFTVAVRTDLVDRHSDYVARGAEDRHSASLQFFEKLGLIGLLNEHEQHRIFSRAIERLWTTHQGMNNFYNEPPFAERLLEISLASAVPETIQDGYVQVVVCCRIGNGYGVSNAACPSYDQMIRNFSPREIAIMLRSATDVSSLVGVRLRQKSNCQSAFRHAVGLLDAASIPSGVQNLYERFSSADEPLT